MMKQPPKKLKRLPIKNSQSSPKRVLYVEDASVLRETISGLLELNGYEVACAKDGQEGVQMALHWHPDVVLMDLRMPIMDGYEAISNIKSDPRTHHIPAFVISAWSGKKERVQAKLAGADKFFVKPPELNSLVEAIEEAIPVSRRSK